MKTRNRSSNSMPVLILAMVFTLLCQARLLAQDGKSVENKKTPPNELILDHKTQKWTFKCSDCRCKEKVVKDGAKIRVRGEKLVVRVKNSNSLFNKLSVTDKTVDSPNVSGLYTFLGKTGPYLTDLATFGGGGLYQFAVPTKNGLPTLNDLVNKIDLKDDYVSVDELRIATFQVVQRIRKNPESVKTASADLRQEIGLGFGGRKDGQACTASDPKCKPEYFITLEALVARYATLAKDCSDGNNDSCKDATNLVKEITAARSLEPVAIRALRADDEIADSLVVPFAKAKSVTVSVGPTDANGLGEFSTLQPVDINVTAVRDWILRPTVGLMFSHAYKAVFPKYSAKKTESGQFQITETSKQDSRVSLLLQLGVQIRPLGYRGVAFSIDGFMNPSDDVKSLGLGMGVNAGPLKLGVGYLWTKHEVLSDLVEDQIIPTAEDLKTHSTYSRPSVLITIGISGVPPFVSK